MTHSEFGEKSQECPDSLFLQVALALFLLMSIPSEEGVADINSTTNYLNCACMSFEVNTDSGLLLNKNDPRSISNILIVLRASSYTSDNSIYKKV